MEHRAKPGASMESMRSTAYVTEDYTKEVAQRAGLSLKRRARLTPTQDTADHPNGAWSLPPFFRSGDKDKYSAIGESDRMTLKFKSPAKRLECRECLKAVIGSRCHYGAALIEA